MRTVILLTLVLMAPSVFAGMDSTGVTTPPVGPAGLKGSTGLSGVVAPLEGKVIVCKKTASPVWGGTYTSYYGAAKVQNGRLYTLAYTGSYSLQLGTRSTGWKLGKEATYKVTSTYRVHSTSDATGVSVWTTQDTYDAIGNMTNSVTSLACTVPWPGN